MFVVLAAFIVRPVAFKYRSKRESTAWRTSWDWALFAGGAVPALIFGVAVGNVLQGVPFHLTENLYPMYDGTFYWKFLGLLNPFALLCGVVSFAMLLSHGAAWLVLKTEGVVQDRARRLGSIGGLVAMSGFALAGLWLAFGIEGYALAEQPAANGPSNPLLTEVTKGGNWLAAYAERPWIAIAPALGFIGMGLANRALRSNGEVSPILWSQLGVFGTISTVGLTMFPFILPSSIDPKSSLTVWDASSSHLTLFIMLCVTVFFVPLIVAYTSWVYKILWGKVTEDDVNKAQQSY